MREKLHLSAWSRSAHRHRETEPGAVLFQALRTRLTLWYSGVLAVILIVCGATLYFSLQDLTLRPVATMLEGTAELTANAWFRSPRARCEEPVDRPPAPTIPRRQVTLPVYLACLSLDGTTLGSPFVLGGGGAAPPRFLSSPRIAEVSAANSALDIIDGGEQIGPIYRLIMPVFEPETTKRVGYVMVGRSIDDQLEALQIVRGLLLIVALLALIGSVGGGWLLANRALTPARLAFARQQAFISDASHQLRTPLTVLRADAEVLLRGRDRLSPDDAELVEDIVAETTNLDQLATSLLTLARLDSGAHHLEQEVVDLSALASTITRRVTTLATEHALTLTQETQASPRVLGDRLAIEQAALILVENAIKYTPAGGTITISTGAENGLAILSVEDDGVGIAPEHLDRLGERFYRVDAARSRDSGGAGLGLAIAHGIVTAHRGTLTISSREHQGTRAALSFPAL